MLVVAAGLLVSLALSVVATPLRPGAAFYLLPTRAWEMLSGGLVYMLAHGSTLSANQRKVLEAVEFLFLFLIITSAMPWFGQRRTRRATDVA
jgi:peptidoglycan/LPS O-acetylase OafA/YrhL